MFAITAAASAANYSANDAAIDAAIENAVEVNAFNFSNDVTPGATYVLEGNNDIIALLLTWFLGPLGIHRIYMGADKLTWLWYCLLSCIGIGELLALGDLVFEVIAYFDGSGMGKFYNNPNLIMWL